MRTFSIATSEYDKLKRVTEWLAMAPTDVFHPGDGFYDRVLEFQSKCAPVTENDQNASILEYYICDDQMFARCSRGDVGLNDDFPIQIVPQKIVV